MNRISRYIAVIFAVLLIFAVSSSASEITSISQLNNPQYKVGSDSDGPVLERAMENLPDAEILKYNDLLSEYLALQNGKIDAFTANESEFISAVNNGLENVRTLPGYLGKPVPTAAGISGVSNIPGLTEKFNSFIAGIKSDGTLEAMYKRWVIDNDTNMPVIDVPEKSDIHLTVGTTGTVMPFSFYINSDVTGFDIELGRRFAAHIGATVEFKIYGFGSILMALKSGAVDIALSNLYVTPETEESVKFSDIIFDINCIVVVRDDGKSPAVPAKNETGNFEAFRGKRIGVPVGSIISEMVKEKIPDAQMFYFDLLANLTAALESGKINAFAIDEPVIYMLERENSRYIHYDGNLGSVNNAFIFPKSPKNNPLADEINEYIRRKKSDGTLDEIRALWFGGDEERKTVPDYKNFSATNGTIRIALNNDTPPFSYIKDGRLAGYDVDVILRFCKDKGYRPDFSQMNFSSVLPAVSTGKCDMGIGAISISEERAEAVRFSEPVCSVKTLLLILKSSEKNQQSQNKMADSESKTPIQNQDSRNAGTSRKPKYSTLAELDGKTIGMQPGIIEWDEWAAKNLPHSKIQYYNTYPDLVAALKTHKIEGLLIDFPVLALMAAEDNTLAYIDEPVGKPFGYSFFYAQTKAGKKLCDEMSEYIRKIKASGELDAILSKWQGADESAKIPPDFKSLPAKKGTLTYAAEGSYPPFNYYKGTELAGIDIDIAVEFCRVYGYGLDVQTMLFDATIPAINSGKVDFAGDFTPSEEHEEAVYFSEPYCNARSVVACLKDDSQNVSESYPSLAVKIIGVQTGTTCAELVPEKIPSAKLAYYDSLTDELTALKAGKADAICCSLPAAIFAENEDSRLTRINPPLRETYLYPLFAQTDKDRKLCDEYSAFVKGLWDNGTIDALNAKWLGKDESKKTVDDYSQLPSTNGTIKMAVDASMIPFVYVRDNKIVGYDIDLAVMFCKSKGYALEIENMTFTGVISSVKSGKCDFTQSMNKTPERAENTLFTSSPTIKSGNVLLTIKTHESPNTVNIPLSNFAGKRVGLLIGSDSAKAIEDKIPGVKLRFFDSPGYVLPALRSGRIDAFYCAVPTAVNIIQNHNDFAYIPDYVSITRHTTMFPKTGKGRKLCAEYADFLKTLSADGTLDTLSEKWITGTDESKQITEDYSHLPAENGTLTLSVTEGMMPFVFVKDKRIQGYDIDLAVMFCKSKGCGLKIEITNHNGVLSSLETGKCDFSYSVQWTEERDKNMLFSPIPNAITGSVLLVVKPDGNMNLTEFEKSSQIAHSANDISAAPATVSRTENNSQHEDDEPSFLDDIASSFNKTFIREDRWKLFAEGIMNTMIITVSSIFCGMLLGFTAFMFCRTGSKVANVITKFSVWLIKGTPIVVLLMILYYIIFGHVNISGIVVSIIAFTLTFGTSVYRMLTFGTGAVDRGQTEAAYALGFTDMKTFFTVILPQAALHFMPSFKEEVTMLIKSTSVVGYIAVQDLTKMGDIVRSRTYEAFFPLIAVAAIYFVLAGMLNIIVNIIHVRITPSKRKPEDILRGIDTARGNENHD